MYFGHTRCILCVFGFDGSTLCPCEQNVTCTVVLADCQTEWECIVQAFTRCMLWVLLGFNGISPCLWLTCLQWECVLGANNMSSLFDFDDSSHCLHEQAVTHWVVWECIPSLQVYKILFCVSCLILMGVLPAALTPYLTCESMYLRHTQYVFSVWFLWEFFLPALTGCDSLTVCESQSVYFRHAYKMYSVCLVWFGW